MTQSTFFYAPNRPDNHKGDVASSVTVMWIVETKAGGFWHPRFDTASNTRKRARDIARSMWMKTRVVPYKACIDTQGRHNRQVCSERLDA